MNDKNLELLNSQICLYETENGNISLEVKLERDSLWLSQKHMAELFNIDSKTVNWHLKNIFSDGELDKNSVIWYYQVTASDGKNYKTQFYNLDAILSVGYRVNSKKGTQFRKWATKILNDYLTKGYSINEKKISVDKLQELQKSIDFLSQNLLKNNYSINESHQILILIQNFTKTWSTLLQYDENSIIQEDIVNDKILQDLNYDYVLVEISVFKNQLMKTGEASDLFGRIRDDGLKGILNNISQTFDQVPLYQTNSHRAAVLLYSIVKNHPFADGNKRIGAMLFLSFLKKANILKDSLSQSSLAALTILTAVSDPNDRELILSLTTKLIGI